MAPQTIVLVYWEEIDEPDVIGPFTPERAVTVVAGALSDERVRDAETAVMFPDFASLREAYNDLFDGGE